MRNIQWPVVSGTESRNDEAREGARRNYQSQGDGVHGDLVGLEVAAEGAQGEVGEIRDGAREPRNGGVRRNSLAFMWDSLARDFNRRG